MLSVDERCLPVVRPFLKPVALASVLALSVGAEQATTVTYQDKDKGAFNGHGNTKVKVTSANELAKPLTVLAGGFHLKGDIFDKGEVNFVAWCLDILHVLAKSAEYAVTKTPFVGDPMTAEQTKNIGKLFNTAYLDVDLKDHAQSAGFQLALWEIIYENPLEAFDLAKGNLQLAGKKEAAGKALAAGQGYLNNLDGAQTRRWSLTFLESKDNQDLVTATPVPVPAAAGLLLLALGGLGLAGRRRRTA